MAAGHTVFGAMFLLRRGGRRLSLSSDAIKRVYIGVKPTLAPFAAPGYGGVAETDDGPCAVLDVVDCLPSPRLMALVDVKGGQILISADDLLPLEQLRLRSDALIENGCDVIEQFVSYLTPAAQNHSISRRLEAAPTLRHFLIIHDCGNFIAIPVKFINSICRPIHVRRPVLGGAAAVETEDGLWPGGWLSELCGDLKNGVKKDDSCAQWALDIGEAEDKQILLTQNIKEFHVTNDDAVKRLPTGSSWLRHPRLGLIEIISIQAGENGETLQDFSAPSYEVTKQSVAKTQEAPSPPVFAPDAAISLRVGPFIIVLPSILVVQAIDASFKNSLSLRRAPGATPLINLAAMFGVARSVHDDHQAVVIVRTNGLRLALQADDARLTPSDAPWRPLPMAPPLAAALFTAMRLREGVGEFLLRPPPYPLRNAAFRAALAAGFVGWLSSFE